MPCDFSLYLGRDFVTGNLDAILPVPHIHHHVMFSPNWQNVLQIWSKCLQTTNST